MATTTVSLAPIRRHRLTLSSRIGAYLGLAGVRHA
jgi:hypothetical protein